MVPNTEWDNQREEVTEEPKENSPWKDSPQLEEELLEDITDQAEKHQEDLLTVERLDTEA